MTPQGKLIKEILDFLDNHTSEYAGVAGNSELWQKVKEWKAQVGQPELNGEDPKTT